MIYYGVFQWIEQTLVNWLSSALQVLRNANPSRKWKEHQLFSIEYALKPDCVFSLGGKANTRKVHISKDIAFNKGKVRKSVGGG